MRKYRTLNLLIAEFHVWLCLHHLHFSVTGCRIREGFLLKDVCIRGRFRPVCATQSGWSWVDFSSIILAVSLSQTPPWRCTCTIPGSPVSLSTTPSLQWVYHVMSHGCHVHVISKVTVSCDVTWLSCTPSHSEYRVMSNECQCSL